MEIFLEVTIAVKEEVGIVLVKIIIKLRTRLYRRYRTGLRRLRSKD
jgi:hypothetical protein